MKVDYMKPNNVKRVPITDRTYRTLSNGNRVPTFTKMVRQLNNEMRNA